MSSIHGYFDSCLEPRLLTCIMSSGEDYWLLIVDGYVREQNKPFSLIIPQDVNTVIGKCYKDELRYFQKCNDKVFAVKNEGRMILPTKVFGQLEICDNYMIFPSANGFKKRCA